MDTGFYVGPLGLLLPLPDVSSAVEVATDRIGSSSRSLMGRQWRDTLGYQRTWTWKWLDLLPSQLPYVEALSTGMVPGPLRLIDPRRANRLPEQVASGGSRSRSPDGFAVTSGGLTYRNLRSVEPDPATLGPRALLRGCIEWGRSAGGDGLLYPVTPDGEPWQVPVLPEQPLELSCWVAGKAGLTVGIVWDEYDEDGNASSHSSDADGDEVELQSGAWQQLVVNVLPSDLSAGLVPMLMTPPGAPSGVVLTTAWQVAALDAEEPPVGLWSGRVPVEQAAGWRIGGGAPFVVADPIASTYVRYGFHDAGLVLVET
ncbi:hypothetical protein [Pseudonocardia sp. NPDC049635]|uniref:hypothetical protein n=1 Tax=Pseudonocardia sp. NPDC049635 TaxID=3155506 RepID=UPI0033D060DD